MCYSFGITSGLVIDLFRGFEQGQIYPKLHKKNSRTPLHDNYSFHLLYIITHRVKIIYRDVEPVLSESQKVLWLTLEGLGREEEKKC